MSLAGRPVTVAGGGVAGLAVARALALRGAGVTLHEQAPEIGEVGAGLQISPNGLRVIDALGMGEALRAVSVRARAIRLRDYRGGEVLRLDLAAHAPRDDYLLVHRARLVEVLEAGARAAGVAVRTGSRVGPSAGEGLTIGADGLHSAMRADLNGPAPPFFTGQVAWRALVSDPDADPEVQVFMGPRRHLVTYPLAWGLRNIVAVEERAGWAEEGWHHEDDPDTLRRAFAGFAPEVRAWLAQVEQVHLWGLFRHPVAARWHDDRRAILGDAAHPTLPFLAQGANMALEDAWVLAERLDRLPQAEALAAFQQARRDRVSRVIAAANANARNYHLSSPLLRGAAHAVLRLGGALAPGAALRRFDWIYGHDVTGAGGGIS
jgi:salicylate hydroxylase